MKVTSIRTGLKVEIPAADVKRIQSDKDGTLILRWTGGFIICQEEYLSTALLWLSEVEKPKKVAA